MQVFLFRSRNYLTVVGFSPRHAGGNLPSEFGPWDLLERYLMLPGMPIAGVAGGSDEVLAAIELHGFLVSKSEVHVSRTTGTTR